LLSVCLDSIRKQWLKNGLILLIVVLSLVRLFAWYSGDTRLGLVISNTNEDWRGVSAYLGDHVQTGDGVLYFPTYIQENVDYYRSKQDAFMNEINLQPMLFWAAAFDSFSGRVAFVYAQRFFSCLVCFC